MHWRNVALVGMLLTISAFAQTRPRVALVLEGGGALGLAHVGVLQWLEQNHIAIDAVAGTSMGGLVGGLYAAGKSPAEIETLIREIDWDVVLAGQAQYRDLSFRRKEDRLAYPNRLSFGLKNGFSLPGGLNAGHEIGLLFDRTLLPYYDLKSFDELPIPFRCVATELISGTEKVFDSGPLSTALRATMSIPAVFSPVRLNGKVYTDGAAVNNLPVSAAKQMGADIVIAVYLDTGPSNEKSFYSLVGVAGRNISIMIAANEIKSLASADILLSADLKDYGNFDFKKAQEIIPKGKEAAERKSALLKRLALNDAEWTQYTTQRSSKVRSFVPVPKFVAAEGASRGNQAAIEDQLQGLKDTQVDPAEVEKRISHLIGLGPFGSIDYGISERNGEPGLRLIVNEKRYGPPFLNLGLTIDGTDPSDVRFGMSGRLTFLNFGGFSSEWRTDFFFGTVDGLISEFYRPISRNRRLFVAPRALVTTSLTDLYVKNSRLEQFRYNRAGVGVDLGYTFNRYSELRVGEEFGWFSSKLRIGVPLLANQTNQAAITSARYRLETVDDAVVPHSGFRGSGSYQWFSQRASGTGGFHQAEIRMSQFVPISQKQTIFVAANGGSAFGASGLGFQVFSLGGPQLLSAYGRNELLGNQYWLLQGGYLREITRLSPLLGGAIYGLAAYEAGKVYGNPLAPRVPQSGTVAVIVKSAIGPVFLGGSIGDSDHYKWWFGLGRIF